jgi:sedoheptulose-bisphosphatase
MTGRDMVGACLALYGPRTTIIVYNEKIEQCQEFSLKEGEEEEEFWVLTRQKIRVAPQTRIFAAMNARAIVDHIAYRECIEFWIKTGYTLRYSGALSADAYHLLIKGEGVYAQVGSKSMKAKLRLLYELLPVAFLVDKAGGSSTNGNENLLDLVIEGYYQKETAVIGSLDEVERFERFVKAHAVDQKALDEKLAGN